MKSGRRKEPRIVTLETYQRPEVCLATAADYLKLDARTVRARIEAGELQAITDGKVYRIPVSALQTYEVKRLST